MVCLGLEPRVAGWKTQTNPLSYGGTPFSGRSYLEKLKRTKLVLSNLIGFSKILTNQNALNKCRMILRGKYCL